MKVTVIQHSTSGHAGLIGDYIIAKAGGTIQTLFSDQILGLSVEAVRADLVVVLGSANGVYETHIPWVAHQRQLMKALVEESIPVFGVCFGAQLIATAIGGEVRPTGNFHLGWYENDRSASSLWRGPWLRWHGDHITLPPEAEVCAEADGLIQAFRYKSAVGVQFHPEVSTGMLDQWAEEATLTGALADRVADVSDYAQANAERIRNEAFALFDHVFDLLKLTGSHSS
jgi:GMP synthase (glutamine-hydrolysing)